MKNKNNWLSNKIAQANVDCVWASKRPHGEQFTALDIYKSILSSLKK